MKPLYMALRYWAGCIFIMALFTAFWGLVRLDGWAVFLSLSVFLMGAVFSFPLILPCMLLLRLTAKLPYSAIGKTWWFAVIYSLLYLLVAYLVRPFQEKIFGPPPDSSIFYFAVAAVFIVTWLSRNDLKNLYKQQTNQQ
jgi:hypothetical protein